MLAQKGLNISYEVGNINYIIDGPIGLTVSSEGFKLDLPSLTSFTMSDRLGR